VEALLALLLHAAPTNVLDLSGWNAGAREDSLHHVSGEVLGTDVSKVPFVCGCAPDRGSHGVDNHGFSHRSLLRRRVCFPIIGPPLAWGGDKTTHLFVPSERVSRSARTVCRGVNIAPVARPPCLRPGYRTSGEFRLGTAGNRSPGSDPCRRHRARGR